MATLLLEGCRDSSNNTALIRSAVAIVVVVVVVAGVAFLYMARDNDIPSRLIRDIACVHLDRTDMVCVCVRSSSSSSSSSSFETTLPFLDRRLNSGSLSS